MTIPQSLIDAIIEYQTRWRHPQYKALEPISKVYSLFPKETGITPDCWPGPYPNAIGKGVYFMFDIDMRLAYIGKASCDSWFAACFSRHFSGGMRTDCGIKQSKHTAVKFVATLKMEYPHEAPSLEEFLITRFSVPGGLLINYAGNPHHPSKAAALAAKAATLAPKEITVSPTAE